MKSWAKTARRDRLRHTGTTFLVLMLLGGIALPQETTLRSQSNVVLVPVLVKDQQGGIVYGLQAKDFIVEDDGAEQQRFIEEIDAGMVFINGMVASDPRLPFGGVKMSGLGRENGRAAIEHYSQLKSVYVAMTDVASPY